MHPVLQSIQQHLGQFDWRRQLSALWFLVFCLFCYWGVQSVCEYLLTSEDSQIRRVLVHGQLKHVNEQQVVGAIDQSNFNSFFKVDVNRVQQQVSRLHWVRSVSVRKQWPDTLKVYVVEQQPVARWNSDMLINRYHEVFQAPHSVAEKNLPALYGPEGSEQEAWRTFERFSKQLLVHNFQLESLALSERFSWQLSLKNGIRINLGREEKARRLQRFIDVYPDIKKYNEQRVDVVDLRYDTGLAVSWKPQLDNIKSET